MGSIGGFVSTSESASRRPGLQIWGASGAVETCTVAQAQIAVLSPRSVPAEGDRVVAAGGFWVDVSEFRQATDDRLFIVNVPPRSPSTVLV
jgi:hypothetical protein